MSYLEKSGESSTCITMAGTPPKVLIRSRSMSSSARSGSKWCIITSFPPAARFETMTEWHPVAWKSGTERRKALGAFSFLASAPTASPSLSPPPPLSSSREMSELP